MSASHELSNRDSSSSHKVVSYSDYDFEIPFPKDISESLQCRNIFSIYITMKQYSVLHDRKFVFRSLIFIYTVIF